MAIIFNLRCPLCLTEKQLVSSYLSLLIKGKQIELTHPCESEEIKEHGYTEEEAIRNGLLFDNLQHACKECGHTGYIKVPVKNNTFGDLTKNIISALWSQKRRGKQNASTPCPKCGADQFVRIEELNQYDHLWCESCQARSIPVISTETLET